MPQISRVQTGKEKNAPISDFKAIFPDKRTFVTKVKNKPILMHLTRQNFESSFVYDNHSSLSSTLESIVPLTIFLSQMLHPFIVLTKANCLALSIWQHEHNSIKLACHYWHIPALPALLMQRRCMIHSFWSFHGGTSNSYQCWPVKNVGTNVKGNVLSIFVCYLLLWIWPPLHTEVFWQWRNCERICHQEYFIETPDYHHLPTEVEKWYLT